MIQTSRVYPMLCEGFAQRQGCCVDYQWDDQVSQQQRVHVPVRVLHTCTAHAGLTAQEVYDTVVVREGGLWTRMESYLQSAFPALLEADGFASQAHFTGHGKTRVLHVRLPSAMPNELAMVQAWAAMTFAPGDVEVT